MEDSPAHGQCGCSPAWASYFENERHADITIVCRDGRAIKAHKLVLSLGSPYFEKALNPAHNFKESQSNEVQLHDEEPAVVKAVLQFIYTRDYACASVSSPGLDDSTTHTNDHDDEDDSLAAELIFHAAMHAAAGYFLMPALANIAFTRFDALATADWPRTAAALPAVIAFVYENSPSSSPASPAPSPSPPASPSPSASTNPFTNTNTTNTPTSPTPPSPPHRLRTLLTTLCAPNFSTLTSNPAFNAMMDAVGAFGRELAALLAKRNKALKQEFGGRRFLCTYCVERYCVQMDGCEGLVCGFCRRGGEVVALR